MRLKAGLAMLLSASMLAGCASGPDVRTTSYRRQQPTPVRSLLIVVDDRLFERAHLKREGGHFASSLGATLKNTAGSIPVSLLQIDSDTDARTLPRTLLATHATQIMSVTAVSTRANLRGYAEATWQLTLSDVTATIVPDEHDASQMNTRVETRPFYQQEIDSILWKGLDALIGGTEKNAETMGQAIAARLRADHALRPDPSVSAGIVSTR
jgi:hypothetical protein